MRFYNKQPRFAGVLRATAALKRFFFYEWRLWYVNESDWEKKRHPQAFQCRRRRIRHDVCFILQALGRSESRDLHGIDPGFCSEIMADDSQAGDTRLSDYNVIHERGRSTLTYIKMD